VVLQIEGTTMQQVGAVNGDERSFTSTLTTSGNILTTNDSCPEPASGRHEFTATTAALSIYGLDSTGTVEQRYSKR
jgi:hypothetical protein